MTDREIFEAMCDMVADIEKLADECYEKDCLSTQIQLDWIGQRMIDAMKIWQKEIQK